MRPLVMKMSGKGLLIPELILGAIIMAFATLWLPIVIISIDSSLILNPFVLGVVIIGILIFSSVGYFFFIRPYLIYRRLPSVLAETDGDYLYVHANKDEKIPISALSNATVHSELPYLLQKAFMREILIHLLSEEYGDLILDVPGYGVYKMRFVARVKEAEYRLGFYLNL